MSVQAAAEHALAAGPLPVGKQLLQRPPLIPACEAHVGQGHEATPCAMAGQPAHMHNMNTDGPDILQGGSQGATVWEDTAGVSRGSSAAESLGRAMRCAGPASCLFAGRPLRAARAPSGLGTRCRPQAPPLCLPVPGGRVHHKQRDLRQRVVAVVQVVQKGVALPSHILQANRSCKAGSSRVRAACCQKRKGARNGKCSGATAAAAAGPTAVTMAAAAEACSHLQGSIQPSRATPHGAGRACKAVCTLTRG